MSDDFRVPFNPLDKRHLGESVAQAMLQQPVESLDTLDPFEGAGIYAIYYVGKFPAYTRIAQQNWNNKFQCPIYIGKAVPKGTRKGANLAALPGKALYTRLIQHAKSIHEAGNLNIQDFMCRYLIVDDIWIPLGEALLISKFDPVWNILIDGFGNHDPGKGRHAGLRPRWDVLHPGRDWAKNCQPRKESASQISKEVSNYLENNILPDNNVMITGG